MKDSYKEQLTLYGWLRNAASAYSAFLAFLLFTEEAARTLPVKIALVAAVLSAGMVYAGLVDSLRDADGETAGDGLFPNIVIVGAKVLFVFALGTAGYAVMKL